jgi:hypothetical protein
MHHTLESTKYSNSNISLEKLRSISLLKETLQRRLELVVLVSPLSTPQQELEPSLRLDRFLLNMAQVEKFFHTPNQEK